MTGMRVRVIPKGPVLIPGPVRIEVPDEVASAAPRNGRRAPLG